MNNVTPGSKSKKSTLTLNRVKLLFHPLVRIGLKNKRFIFFIRSPIGWSSERKFRCRLGFRASLDGIFLALRGLKQDTSILNSPETAIRIPDVKE